MKKIITVIAILLSLNASAQLADSTAYKDSAINTYANNQMPLVLPVKAIILYGYYLQNNFSWANRLAPDVLKPYIGSGTKPDSLVSISFTAKQISDFPQNIQGERYGAIYNYARSIFENVPAISGYTSLINQLFTLGVTGTKTQKNGFTYINTKYGAYSTNLTNLISVYYNQGLYWIQH